MPWIVGSGSVWICRVSSSTCDADRQPPIVDSVCKPGCDRSRSTRSARMASWASRSKAAWLYYYLQSYTNFPTPLRLRLAEMYLPAV
jgi:hypothetical protein